MMRWKRWMVAVLAMVPWGLGCGASCGGDHSGTARDAAVDAAVVDAAPDSAEIDWGWLPWPDAAPDSDVDAWVPPDACLTVEQNPNVLELPPSGNRDLGGFTNWSTFVTYAEDWGNYGKDIFYYSILENIGERVTERLSAQVDPYGHGDEIIYADHQFFDSQNEIYRIELYQFSIGQGTETRVTDDPAAKSQPRINADYLLYLSSEGCSAYYDMKLVLQDRQTGESTVLADCDQDPETHSISEHFAAWSAKPYPGHNKDIFVRDLAGQTTIHIESTGPGSQFFPHTDEDHVVWEDDRDGRREVYMYTFSTGVEECLTPDGWEQAWPHLRDGVVAWCDYRFSQDWGFMGECDVYVHEITTGLGRRVTQCSRKWRPKFVDSGWVLYGNWFTNQKGKLYVHDLVAEGILSTDGHVLP